MKEKRINLSNITILKWTAALMIIFSFALPFAIVGRASNDTYCVRVESGYLALRTAKAFERSNEIGELYTGDTVEVSDYSDSTYWYVYSSKLGKSGYVNKNYLVSASTSGSGWTVSVSEGYLALRSAKAFERSNEIGELYTGDTVEVLDSSDSTYWYVYSSKHGKKGYVNKNYLKNSAGSSENYGPSRTVRVNEGYLALRSAKAFDSANEIGELYTGDTVQVIDSSDSTYWYVYSPKHGKKGYVNKNYLEDSSSESYGPSKTVSVSEGYLALRSAKAFDSANEIGELYTGDTVQVIDSSDSAYWYVYSPKHGKKGYVNKNYLKGSSGSSSSPSFIDTKTVKVKSGYLALRNAKAYDSANEIGELYTGDTVKVVSKDSGTYWYVYSPKLDKYGYVNKDYLR